MKSSFQRICRLDVKISFYIFIRIFVEIMADSLSHRFDCFFFFFRLLTFFRMCYRSARRMIQYPQTGGVSRFGLSLAHTYKKKRLKFVLLCHSKTSDKNWNLNPFNCWKPIVLLVVHYNHTRKLIFGEVCCYYNCLSFFLFII